MPISVRNSHFTRVLAHQEAPSSILYASLREKVLLYEGSGACRGPRGARGRPDLMKMSPEGPGRPKCCFFDDFGVPPGGPWRHQNRQVGPQHRKKSLQSRVQHACEPERCKFSVAGSIFTCFGGQNWIKNCVFLDAFGKV